MNVEQQNEIDYQLLLQIRSGNDDAFSSLIKRWHKRIYNYAIRYSNDANFTEEVVQKTFIQLHKNLKQLEDLKSFKPWLYRMITNMCISESRMLKRRRRFSYEEKMAPPVIDGTNPHKLYAAEERKDLVRLALQQLSPQQREVIIMKEFEGLKFREIAEALGASENTVKSRMYYGLDALKKILLKQKWTKDLYYE